MHTHTILKTLTLTLSTASIAAIAALPGVAADFNGLQSTGLDCSSSLVTAGGSDFTACQGAFKGNDTGAKSALLEALNGGLFDEFTEPGTWSLWGKSDEGQFFAEQGNTSGTWNLLNGDSLTGPFVLSLKASNAYSAYLFNEGTEILGGTFSTGGVSTNRKGKAQDLSHASIFVQTAANDNSVELDEPSLSGSGYLLLLAGAPLALSMSKSKQKEA